jgi:WbqC-like protein
VKVGIMQPYLFPYIGYFQLLNAVDRFVVYDDVAFIKQGWVNRNRILINDHPAYFTVPVKHASSFSLICDTLVDDRHHSRWVEKTLTTFSNTYRRAPEFGQVFPVVEAVLTRQTDRVAELAVASLKAVAALLEIRTEWVESSAQYGNTDLKGEDRVLAICRAEGATEYVNAAGGRELYARDRFEAAGLRLRFIQSAPIEYRQFGSAFVPSLSIVDVLMFNPLDRVRTFLDACEVT